MIREYLTSGKIFSPKLKKKSELTDYFAEEFSKISDKPRNKIYCFKFMKITLKKSLQGFIIDFSAKGIDLAELKELIKVFFRFPFKIGKKNKDIDTFIPIRNECVSPASASDDDGRLSVCSDGRLSVCSISSLCYDYTDDGIRVLKPEKKKQKKC